MPEPYSAGDYEVEPVEVTPAPVPEPTPEPAPESPAPEPVSVPEVSPEATPSPAPVANPDAAPETTPEPATPDTTPPDVPPASPELFELPDGRKLTAQQVREEYMNLLPEFTRKSQRLAELEGNPPITNPNEDVPEWKKEGFQVKSVAELVEIVARETENTLRSREIAEAQSLQDAAKVVDDQIAVIKQTDPNLNEPALFQHANKYGFTDLTKAHANMIEMGKIRTETEKTVLNNLKQREADPVAAAHGNPVTNEELNPDETGQFTTALDYLNRNKK